MNADTKCSTCSRPIDATDRWSMQAPVATADGMLCAPCYLGESPAEVVGDGEEVRDDDQ